MSRCGRWCVVLFVLVNIVSLTVGEHLQDNEIRSDNGEDGNNSRQKRDEKHGKSPQQIVNVKIPPCKQKTEFVTTQIYETLAVRSHCEQKVVYSSTGEVVSTSTECKGYMCNPKIPYVYSEDYINSDVDESYHEKNAPEYRTPKQISEIFDNHTYIPHGNYTMPVESYTENFTPEYGPPKQSSETYNTPSSIPYGKNIILDESYPENYKPEYEPPKQSSETYDSPSSIPYEKYTMHDESYPESYTPEYGPPKQSSVYNYFDSGVLAISVTSESTTSPTTTTTISYKEPSTNHNKTGPLTQIVSRLRDSFLRGFFRTDDHLKQAHMENSVTPSKPKPTYFTAVVKDPGHIDSISNEISFSRPSPLITPHSSIYQPTSIDLTAYSDLVHSLVASSSYENVKK